MLRRRVSFLHPICCRNDAQSGCRSSRFLSRKCTYMGPGPGCPTVLNIAVPACRVLLPRRKVEHAQNGKTHSGNRHRRRAMILNPAYKPYLILPFRAGISPFGSPFHTRKRTPRTCRNINFMTFMRGQRGRDVPFSPLCTDPIVQGIPQG